MPRIIDNEQGNDMLLFHYKIEQKRMTFSEYMDKVKHSNQPERSESDIETASESETSVNSNVV